MKTSMIIAAAVVSMGLLLTGCPKNNDKEAQTEVTPAPAADTTATDPNAGANTMSQEELAAQELENKRAQLEEMINRIMSEDVYFDYDKAELTEKARELLAQVGDILIKETKFAVEVEGHTDERGTESYNMSLGGKRAQAVQKYLTTYGVDASRITTMSYGEEKPKAEGSGEDAFAQNRRANFKVKIVE